MPPRPGLNLDFFMLRMAAAARTKLLDRELLGLPLLVLRGRIVAPFAAVALQPDQVSHRIILASSSSDAPIARREVIGAHEGNRTLNLFPPKKALSRLTYQRPSSA